MDTTLRCQLNRLDFVLGDFTRVIWVSKEAEDAWSPRISSINHAIKWLETETVVRGIRSCALISCSFADLIDISNNLAKLGLISVPVSLQGIPKLYASTTVPGKDQYRVVVTSPKIYLEFIKAWRDNDNQAIGYLLGFPKCCIEFFQKYWVDEKFLDTSWPMVKDIVKGDEASFVNNFLNCNILLRWLGIRSVFHLPCSFHCNDTDEIGNINLTVLKEKFVKEAEWLEEMLQWPIEWSCLHGIAEIKTPVCTISSRTDATGKKYTIKLAGTVYPNEGAKGVNFPYTEGSKMKDIWSSNGFNTKAAMDRAHKKIVDVVNSFNPNSVIDLGCGNGELLKKIDARIQLGVEVNKKKYNEAALHNPKASYYNENINSFKLGLYDIILISENRFREFEDETIAQEFMAKLQKSCKVVVNYSYENDFVYVHEGSL